jgi:hypothetical protein
MSEEIIYERMAAIIRQLELLERSRDILDKQFMGLAERLVDLEDRFDVLVKQS